MARNERVEVQGRETLHRFDGSREVVVRAADREDRPDEGEICSPQQSLVGEVDGVQRVGVVQVIVRGAWESPLRRSPVQPMCHNAHRLNY